MVFDASSFNTRHYKVWIEGKVELQGKELCPLLHLNVVVTEKEAFETPLTTVVTFTLYIYIYIYIYSHPQTDLFRSIRTHQCA